MLYPRNLVIFPPPIVAKFPLQQSATSYMCFSRKHPHMTMLCLLSEIIHILLSEIQEKSYLSVKFHLKRQLGKTYPETGPCKWSW